MERPLVVYVDVDETLIRNVSSKRIPIGGVIKHVRSLKEQGAILYCWSTGGADYAKQSADEVGLSDCFAGYLPKPNVLIDDQVVSEWRSCMTVHPLSCDERGGRDYRKQLFRE
ncbi:DUF705 domain-containing protein [bacterium]|nr:DUF705 domain-containing protein [bacterium]